MELRTTRLERVRHRRTARATTPAPRARQLNPASTTPGVLKSGRLDPRARPDAPG